MSGNRIRELREKAGLSQAQLAEAANTSTQHISRLERSERPLSDRWLDRIAPALGVRQIDLLATPASGKITGSASVQGDAQVRRSGDVGRPTDADLYDGLIEVGSAEYAAIKRYDAELSAGPGSLFEGEPEPLGYHLIEYEWLRAFTRTAPKHLAIVQVRGDSMEPTLSDGDWVLANMSQRRLSHEGVYCIRVGDAVWVKRLSMCLKTGHVRVLSDNALYESEELAPDSMEILGRAVAIVARRL